jgi:hypothetical protein
MSESETEFVTRRKPEEHELAIVSALEEGLAAEMAEAIDNGCVIGDGPAVAQITVLRCVGGRMRRIVIRVEIDNAGEVH